MHDAARLDRVTRRLPLGNFEDHPPHSLATEAALPANSLEDIAAVLAATASHATFENEGPRFIRGDYNLDTQINLSDPIALLTYLFLAGAEGPCADAGDFDDSGVLDLSDAIASLNYQFLGGPDPKPPFPAEGRDPTAADDLGCRA